MIFLLRLGALPVLLAVASPAHATTCENPFLHDDRRLVIAPCTKIIEDKAASSEARAAAYEARGRAFRLLKQTDVARADLEAGLLLDKKSAGLLDLRATLAFERGDMAGAWRDAEHAASLSPRNSKILGLMMLIAKVSDDFAGAERIADLALSIDATSPFLNMHKGELLAERHEHKLALAAFDISLSPDREREKRHLRFDWFGKTVPADVWINLKRAHALRALGDHDRAREIVDRMAQEAPSEATIAEQADHSALRPLRYGESNLAETLRLADAALAINPRYGRAEAIRADVLLQQRKFADALAAIERAIRLGGRPEHFWQRGLVLRALGRSDEAFVNLGAFLAIDPSALPTVVSRLRRIGLFQETETPAGVTAALLDGLKACSIDPRCW